MEEVEDLERGEDRARGGDRARRGEDRGRGGGLEDTAEEEGGGHRERYLLYTRIYGEGKIFGKYRLSKKKGYRCSEQIFQNFCFVRIFGKTFWENVYSIVFQNLI